MHICDMELSRAVQTGEVRRSLMQAFDLDSIRKVFLVDQVPRVCFLIIGMS